ncbi:hypothetical protein [Pedobacter frigiditerrae]|uniref:hypothetical protein n=1 Tax=Pedobacter frigiditerrae TaxID=2530452 RepID=UPI00292F6148|nr:hypothetical protein [Pedobacter frigiditerrae]
MQSRAIMTLNLHENVWIFVTLGVQNTQGANALRVFFLYQACIAAITEKIFSE